MVRVVLSMVLVVILVVMDVFLRDLKAVLVILAEGGSRAPEAALFFNFIFCVSF